MLIVSTPSTYPNADEDDLHGEETQAASRVRHCSFVRTNLVIICD
jgi:hypothetical protein